MNTAIQAGVLYALVMFLVGFLLGTKGAANLNGAPGLSLV
jgi:hypothetical protein